MLQQGPGVKSDNDGDVYQGVRVNGKLNGFGICTFADGTQCEGYYKDDVMSGKGRFIWKDKTVYIGDFE